MTLNMLCVGTSVGSRFVIKSADVFVLHLVTCSRNGS